MGNKAKLLLIPTAAALGLLAMTGCTSVTDYSVKSYQGYMLNPPPGFEYHENLAFGGSTVIVSDDEMMPEPRLLSPADAK